jgi:uncharacterized beta-barrel protein YwiB (DUF1934 family)
MRFAILRNGYVPKGGERMEEKEVMLSIVGTQSAPDGEEATVELLTKGTYRRQGDVHTLEYVETDPNSRADSKTTITLDGPCVSLLRQGASFSQMFFEEGRKYVSSFHTPLGDMTVGVFPLSVAYRLEENGGEVDLQYQMDWAGKFANLNQFNVNFWEPGHAPQS